VRRQDHDAYAELPNEVVVDVLQKQKHFLLRDVHFAHSLAAQILLLGWKDVEGRRELMGFGRDKTALAARP